MATNFPTSLDALTNPTAVDTLDSPPHDVQHADANDAIEALQAKVGVDGSAVTSSLDYKVNALPSGLVALATTAVGTVGGSNPQQVATVTFTHTANRDLLVMFSANIAFSSNPGGIFAVEFRNNTTGFLYQAVELSTQTVEGVNAFARLEATGSSQTVDVRIAMGSTQTISIADHPAQLLILDVGP